MPNLRFEKMMELIMGLSFSFLSFLIIYGLLNKMKIFEKDANIIISAVISLFVLFAFRYYQDLLSKMFSFLALLIIFVFIFLSLYFFSRRTRL